MGETEIRTPEPKPDAASAANSDAVEIIGKVKDFVSNVKDMAGKPMDVKAGNFKVTVSRTAEGQYSLSVDARFSEVTV